MNTIITIPIRYFIYARKSSESDDKQAASIESQLDELNKIVEKYNLTIVGVYQEKKSAQAPGRPVYNQMMQDIKKGKANGILCWKPDRLARNSVDGGDIIWLLQKGVIQQIKTYHGDYLPNDNHLPLYIEFGMASQYVRDLSENTKRGMRTKVKTGWFPHKPPIGYLNNKHNLDNLKPIYKDPHRFTIVKSLWQTIVHKHCTIKALHKIAKKSGLRTQKGNPLSLSKCHELFRNPFYYGHFKWNGEVYQGNHPPMITKQLFDKAQAVLDGRSFTRKQRHVFAFTGLIRCGECGAIITAEERSKTQKNGNTHHYAYYRCSKRLKACSQPHVREELLEEQIKDILKTITIPSSFHQWTIEQLKTDNMLEIGIAEEMKVSHQKTINACDRKLKTLMDMRLNDEIASEEFTKQREELLAEKRDYEELIDNADKRIENWMTRADKLLNFSVTAKDRFEKGGLEHKREVLVSLGSNLFLKDRKLIISVGKPLKLMQRMAPEVQNLHTRLKLPFEPLNSEASQRVREAYTSHSTKWGRSACCVRAEWHYKAVYLN